MVPPYGIRWEGRIEKNAFNFLKKDSHGDMQIISGRKMEYEFILETR